MKVSRQLILFTEISFDSIVEGVVSCHNKPIEE